MTGASTTLTREYGLSHSDLARILPRLTSATLEAVAGDYLFNFIEGRRLRVTPGPEQFRQIASLRIPFLQITFHFTGWSQTQIGEFFVHFNRAFQKGGG